MSGPVVRGVVYPPNQLNIPLFAYKMNSKWVFVRELIQKGPHLVVPPPPLCHVRGTLLGSYIKFRKFSLRRKTSNVIKFSNWHLGPLLRLQWYPCAVCYVHCIRKLWTHFYQVQLQKVQIMKPHFKYCMAKLNTLWGCVILWAYLEVLKIWVQ